MWQDFLKERSPCFSIRSKQKVHQDAIFAGWDFSPVVYSHCHTRWVGEAEGKEGLVWTQDAHLILMRDRSWRLADDVCRERLLGRSEVVGGSVCPFLRGSGGVL